MHGRDTIRPTALLLITVAFLLDPLAAVELALATAAGALAYAAWITVSPYSGPAGQAHLKQCWRSAYRLLMRP